MNLDLEEKKKSLMAEIEGARQRGDLTAIARLGRVSEKIVLAELAYGRYLSALNDIEPQGNSIQLLGQASNTYGSRKSDSRKKIRLILDWNKLGIKFPIETIDERIDSKTLAAFFTSIDRKLGKESLEKLTHLQIRRGPFLSKNPQADYFNSSTGTIYGHNKVDGTSYYVLTNTSHNEKVEDLGRLATYLNWPQEFMTIEEYKH
jgi:hypothetical protein